MKYNKIVFNNDDLKDIVGSFQSLDDATKWLENNLPPYPKKPNKPKEPNNNATPQQYRDYASSLETYLNEKEEYDKLLKEYREKRISLETVVQKFLWSDSGLDTVVPEQYRDKVWSRAYDLGHSDGYSEIQNHLFGLVEIFE